MTREALEALVRDQLVELAPEFSPDEIQPTEDLREQLDIDSMDLHQLAAALYEATGVDIPEAERADLVTLEKIVEWFHAHQG